MSSLHENPPVGGWAEPARGDWDYRPVGPIPLDRFGDELLKLYVPPLRAKNTFLKMRQAMEIVEAVAGPGATTADLTPALIARFIESRPDGESPRTTHTLLAYVGAACSYAKSQGYIRTSPFEFRKRWIRVGKPEGKTHHSRDEVGRVLALLASDVAFLDGWPRWRARRLHAIVSLFAYTGLRRDEGLWLRATDVDLDGRMVHLVERKGRQFKTEASAKPVPIPSALAPILADWLAHRLDAETGSPRQFDESVGCPYLFPGVSRKGPWTGGPLGHRPLDQLHAVGERAGVQGLTFLSLRHSFATLAPAWGLSADMVKRVLRHTSTATQRYYQHDDLDGMRSAVDRISFGPEGGNGDAS
jgi:integrase